MKKWYSNYYSDGLQPTSDGLQSTSDGLQPKSNKTCANLFSQVHRENDRAKDDIVLIVLKLLNLAKRVSVHEHERSCMYIYICP